MDGPASNNPQGPAPDASSALDAKLAPLDEFRDRAESWMKEITAQVARLAGRSEDEDRRRNALDKRLADIEERMQSLLTLTEMVSLSKNPFARPPSAGAVDETPQTAAPVDAAAGERPGAPQDTPPTAMPAASPSPDASSNTSEDEPRPEPAAADPAPMPHMDRPARTLRPHPNDAAAETAPPTDPIRFPEPSGAPAAPGPRPTPAASGTGHPVKAARERFLILEWSSLLAPVAYRIDLGGFLGFYVEAGWVTSETAAMVRNLSLQLHREEKTDEKAYRLEELHARSIVLISQLEGQDEPVARAQEELEEAREVAMGGWATATR